MITREMSSKWELTRWRRPWDGWICFFDGTWFDLVYVFATGSEGSPCFHNRRRLSPLGNEHTRIDNTRQSDSAFRFVDPPEVFAFPSLGVRWAVGERTLRW